MVVIDENTGNEKKVTNIVCTTVTVEAWKSKNEFALLY